MPIDTCLLDFAKLSTLRCPETRRIRKLEEWLERPGYGDGFLQGVEARAWTPDIDLQNYVAIGDNYEADALTRWLGEFISGPFHDVLGHKFKKPVSNDRRDQGVWDYQKANFVKTVDTLSAVMSSLIPTMSIFALFYARSTIVRLVLVLIFTGIFTFVLAVFTNAKRIDIFAATAA